MLGGLQQFGAQATGQLAPIAAGQFFHLSLQLAVPFAAILFRTSGAITGTGGRLRRLLSSL